MCDFSHLTECLFEGLPKIKAGQRVYVVASRGSTAGEMEVESVLYGDANESPRETLKGFCEAMGLDVAARLCIPVLLPQGLNAEDVKGFKAFRNGNSLHIEFTQ